MLLTELAEYKNFVNSSGIALASIGAYVPPPPPGRDRTMLMKFKQADRL